MNTSNEMGGLTAIEPVAQPKMAADATAKEMLAIESFRKRISENQPNHYEPHNREAADRYLYDRIVAAEKCLSGT